MHGYEMEILRWRVLNKLVRTSWIHGEGRNRKIKWRKGVEENEGEEEKMGNLVRKI